MTLTDLYGVLRRFGLRCTASVDRHGVLTLLFEAADGRPVCDTERPGVFGALSGLDSLAGGEGAGVIVRVRKAACCAGTGEPCEGGRTPAPWDITRADAHAEAGDFQ